MPAKKCASTLKTCGLCEVFKRATAFALPGIATDALLLGTQLGLKPPLAFISSDRRLVHEVLLWHRLRNR
jgi:hypothetical protein